MYHVYILRSQKTGRHYIGSTQNLKLRLQQHNENKTRSIRQQGPFKVIYKEECNTLSEARIRELQIKSYKGGEAFKKLIGVSYRPVG